MGMIISGGIRYTEEDAKRLGKTPDPKVKAVTPAPDEEIKVIKAGKPAEDGAKTLSTQSTDPKKAEADAAAKAEAEAKAKTDAENKAKAGSQNKATTPAETK